MPLILLGLLLIVGVITYWYLVKQNSDEPIDPRSMREHYSIVFDEKAEGIKEDVAKKIRKKAGIYDADFDIEDDGYGSSSDSADDNTIRFPSDVERAKRKHDIH